MLGVTELGMFFFFKQKTAYEMRISDWSSDVCSSDLRHMLLDITKWVAQIDSVDRIPEMVSRGYALAASGRPGPVALVMPEDMLDDEAAIPDAPKELPVQPEPSSAQMVALHARLARSARPFLIVGGVLG